MVNTFPETTTAPDASDTPSIIVNVSTFTASVFGNIGASDRYAAVEITATNIKKTLAVAAFSRLFDYAISLATTDMNPIPNVNQSAPPQFGTGTTPASTCEVLVNKTGIVDTVDLTLTATQLRTDYVDEYFSRTLVYLAATLATDLNPNA